MNRHAQWDGRSTGSAAGTGIFVWLISNAGVVPAYCLLLFVSLFYALTDKKSARAVAALRSHLGQPSSAWRRFRHCFSFGMSIIDRYAFLTGKQSFFTSEARREDLISAAVGKGSGAILLGAHVGNWEIAGNLLTDRLKVPVHYVMMDAERPEMKDILKEAIEARKTNIIPVDSDPLDLVMAVRDAIKKNGIVCMNGDRIGHGQKGQKHNFLGADVSFPLGPFAVAAATGAPIIPVLVTKSGIRKYIFKAYAPILFDGITRENREKYIFTALERYVGILEQAVKEKPYEWFNFYDFWEEGGSPAGSAGVETR
jgi:predicted LPLAT superfamily acyltransferase